MKFELKDLDDLLQFLAEDPDMEAGVTFSYIEKARWEKLGITPAAHYLQLILNKLVDDKYVRKIEISAPGAGKILYFQITWNGVAFQLSGGYRAEISEKQKLTAIQKDLQVLNKRTYWLTTIIAIGTAIAAIYYALEIVKELYIKWK